ncbi:hypothetical protein CR513_23394, partial [Mucuna pruriens]
MVNSSGGSSTDQVQVKGSIRPRDSDPCKACQFWTRIAISSRVGQLNNTMSQLQSVGSENLPSQTIPNLKGDVSIPTPQPKPKLINAKSELEADSLARVVPLPFPTQTIPIRKSKTDEDLLKMFQRVEINIPLLDVIKQILKYAKFLKELCMHKRKKMKEGVEMGGVVSALIKSEEVAALTQ